MYVKIYMTNYENSTKIERKLFNFQLTNEKDFNLFDFKNWLMTQLPILTVELTFACVPAAEGDQSDHADEQDTASTYCTTNNYQHRQGFCNNSSNRRKMWSRGWGQIIVRRKGGMK